jgi:dihydrofolate reductase
VLPAKPDGGLDWLTGFPNPKKTDYSYKDLLTSVDTVIMGGRTYRELLNMDVIWPYPNQHTYVVSHHEWNAKKTSVLSRRTSLKLLPSCARHLAGWRWRIDFNAAGC